MGEEEGFGVVVGSAHFGVFPPFPLFEGVVVVPLGIPLLVEIGVLGSCFTSFGGVSRRRFLLFWGGMDAMIDGGINSGGEMGMKLGSGEDSGLDPCEGEVRGEREVFGWK